MTAVILSVDKAIADRRVQRIYKGLYSYRGRLRRKATPQLHWSRRFPSFPFRRPL